MNRPERRPPRFIDFDTAWLPRGGDGWPIHACGECPDWHAEVIVLDEPLGGCRSTMVIREWHAANCPVLAEWEALMAEDGAP